MKEARIIMPYTTVLTYEGGEVLDAKSHRVHATLKHDLIDAFSGFTRTEGEGGWLGVHGNAMIDQVAIYDIACDEKLDETYAMLFEIALNAGRALDQQSVYIRYPDGVVEIADTKTKVGYPSKRKPANDAGERVVGTKRTPKVGDVWVTRCSSIVEVKSEASILDGGFNCEVTARVSGPHPAGTRFICNLDGQYGTTRHRDDEHPYDLVKFRGEMI